MASLWQIPLALAVTRSNYCASENISAEFIDGPWSFFQSLGNCFATSGFGEAIIEYLISLQYD